MIRALLFDMGGVLISLQGARGLPEGRLDWRGRQALLTVIRRHGGRARDIDLDRLLFDPWRADYERRYEVGYDADWKPHLTRLRRHAGINLHDETLLGAWFRPYGETLTAFRGAAEALKTLRFAGFRIGLVSNVPLPGELYRRILEQYGIARSIESFHFSYDERSRKPSPAMLRRALAALEADPSEALMIGDRRSSDVAAGRAAGTGTIWLRRDDSGGPEPDHIIDELSELPDLAAGLRGAS